MRTRYMIEFSHIKIAFFVNAFFEFFDRARALMERSREGKSP